jgi:hypothetical protein
MLDDEKLKLVVENVANMPDGLLLLEHFIELSGCFTQGIAKDSTTEFYNKGQRDFGLKIRALLIEHAPNKYVELITKEDL